MHVLTGPRSTAKQDAIMVDLSTELGIPLLHHSEGDLLTATTLYRAAGWDTCSLAMADIDVAECYGLTIIDL